jgi:hypothetical protein
MGRTVLLAPDAARCQFDEPLEACNAQGYVTLGRAGKRLGCSMSPAESIALRDWLIAEFGLPECPSCGVGHVPSCVRMAEAFKEWRRAKP